jgi:hypothetical protein
MLKESIPGEDESTVGGSEISSELGLRGGDESGNKRSKGAKKKAKRRKKLEEKEEEDKNFEKVLEEASAPSASSGPASAAKANAKAKAVDKNKEKGKDKDKEKEKEDAEGEAAAPKAKMVKPKLSRAAREQKHRGFTEDQAKLLTLMMKIILQLSQTSREITGILFYTWTLPDSDIFSKNLSVQGRRYNYMVQTPGHGLGSPHLYVFGSLLMTIVSLNLNPADKTLQSDYEAMTMDQRSDVIRLCKLAKLFQPDQRKLALTFGNGPMGQRYKDRVLEVLLGSGRREGWVYRPGRPPSGHMERLLGGWLAEIAS